MEKLYCYHIVKCEKCQWQWKKKKQNKHSISSVLLFYILI